MAATRLRIWRNSGETQEIKTDGWFIELRVPMPVAHMKGCDALSGLPESRGRVNSCKLRARSATRRLRLSRSEGGGRRGKSLTSSNRRVSQTHVGQKMKSAICADCAQIEPEDARIVCSTFVLHRRGFRECGSEDGQAPKSAANVLLMPIHRTHVERKESP